MARPARTDEQLRADSEHVLYEAEMLRGVVDELFRRDTRPGPEPRVTINALLESLVIHARALTEFLYSEDPRDDDVIAADYLPSWPDERPAMSDLLRTIKTRADKEVAHVTRRRATIADDGRAWQYGRVHQAVAVPFKAFTDRVPEHRVREDFHERALVSMPVTVREPETLLRTPTMYHDQTFVARATRGFGPSS